MDDKVKKVLCRLEAQCSKCEYCISDIKMKAVRALDGDSAAVEEVIASLLADKFVDELRYASAFAREKSSLSGWGVNKIRQALMAKHIPNQTIAEALQEIDSGKASEKLEKLMASKWKSLQGDPQAKLKLLRYALGRGYEYDEVQSVAERICKPAN